MCVMKFSNVLPDLACPNHYWYGHSNNDAKRYLGKQIF